MNLARLVQSLVTRVPGSARGTVTFTNRQTGATTSALGVFMPAQPDRFKGPQTAKLKLRSGVVQATALLFAPEEGQTASWDGDTWTVTAVNPLRPSGGGPVLQYRMVLTR
jgi:hypothetical protein